MTGRERDAIEALAGRFDTIEMRLWGEDGTGGEFGRLRPVIDFYQRVTGVAIALGMLCTVIVALSAMLGALKALGVL